MICREQRARDKNIRRTIFCNLIISNKKFFINQITLVNRRKITKNITVLSKNAAIII